MKPGHIAVICILLFLTTLVIYLYKFGSFYLSGDPAVWGQFGDYIGGSLNPMIGIVTIIIVAFTFREQQKITKLEIQRSAKENTPLFMASTYNASSTQTDKHYSFYLTLMRNDIQTGRIEVCNLKNFKYHKLKDLSEGFIKDQAFIFFYSCHLSYFSAYVHSNPSFDLIIHYTDINGTKFCQTMRLSLSDFPVLMPPKLDSSK
jgi:hypothetical protein